MGRTTKPGEKEREIIIEPITAPDPARTMPKPKVDPAPKPVRKRKKVPQRAAHS